MRDVAYVQDLAETIGLKVWPSFLERACCDKKEVFLNGGWRGGKSSSAAFIVFLNIISRWLQTALPLDAQGRPIGSHLIWLVGPEFEQCREEYFYISNWCQRMGIAVDASTATQGPLRMEISFPGMPGRVSVATKSANDPTSLGSVAPVEILACECGQFSEESRDWLWGRALEKNAPIYWSGTFHNDQNKPQHQWYERDSNDAIENPDPRRQAFCLPSWENEYLFGNCLEGEASILRDPTLEVWCPDKNHGEAHKGMLHPMIRLEHNRYRDRPKEWDKRFGGIPTGMQNPVYEWAAQDRLEDITGNRYLISLSAVERQLGKMLWLSTAGGIDPGLVHPAGLVIASTNQHRDIWFRDAQRLQSSNTSSMYELKDHWQKKYGRAGYLQWGGDPVGLKYTRPSDNIIAMTGSVFAREERASIVNSYAVGIDNVQHLYFDADVPGVRQLFAEAQTIHRKRKPSGEWGYNRVGDDLMAAGENAVTVLHSRVFNLSPRQQMPPRYKRQPITVRSAS